MYKKLNYKCIAEGVLRAVVITCVFVVIYTAVTTVVNDSYEVKTATFMIVTCLSVLYGSIFASRMAGKNGWLHGLVIGLSYSICLYIIALLGGRELAINSSDLLRIVAATAVGALSGMLGINL